jgi:porphobilinogen synthase
MPGCYHLSIGYLLKEIEELSALGIKGILLFGIPGNGGNYRYLLFN